VGGAAAGVVRARGVESSLVLVDVNDLALFVDDEGGAIGDAGVLVQNSVRSGHFALGKIAQEGDGNAVDLGKLLLGRGIVSADSKYLSSGLVEFCDTRLVRFEFGRSATGEGGGIERQYDGVLAAEIGELHRLTVGGAQREVRGLVADLERGVWRLDRLAEQSRRGAECERGERQLPHENPPVLKAYHRGKEVLRGGEEDLAGRPHWWYVEDDVD
jgi:hypothetical protein